jgi:hypothetical protein
MFHQKIQGCLGSLFFDGKPVTLKEKTPRNLFFG